jgi:hypothetical protein
MAEMIDARELRSAADRSRKIALEECASLFR